MIDNRRGWHEMLPYALLGYRTTVRTSVGATLYLLVYGTEAVIPAEVEIPLLRIIQEAELGDAEWVRKRIDQLTLIDEKRMVVVCHGQLYRQRMIRAFHKKVRARIFENGQLVLKRIFPHQDEYKVKFAPNWQRPYMVRKYYLEVSWSCRRWTAPNGETNQFRCCQEILRVRFQFVFLSFPCNRSIFL
uniref:Integrase n=1 Tax=Solanum tuberosum TaxID=4113 RepID=M1BPN3_SOLTU